MVMDIFGLESALIERTESVGNYTAGQFPRTCAFCTAAITRGVCGQITFGSGHRWIM